MKTAFIKQNDELLPIEVVPDEHDESRDFEPSFWFYNRRYFLNDFIRVHNNPWISDNFPEFLCGMEPENYTNPIFIELVGSAFINVYEEREII